MVPKFHVAILATAFVATIAVGIASASILMQGDVAPKGDRLPILANSGGAYATVETRKDGISILDSFKVDFD